jgi:hypothetical protein
MADPLHRDWENFVLAVWGAMTFAGKDGGDLNVGHAVASEIDYPVAHFHPTRELGDGVDLHFDFEIGHGAAAPDHSDKGNVVLTTVEHHLLDETP